MPDRTPHEFAWDEDNEDHIVRHDVYPDEAEQVFANRPFIRRGKGSVRYALGRDDAGRYLFVVFVVRGDRVRVITARRMTKTERRDYERHR